MAKIRTGQIEDFNQLNEDWAWGKDQWQREGQKSYIEGIKNGTQMFLVAENDGAVIGELHIFWNAEDKEEANGKDRAYLSAMRLHPDYRGQGIGTKLIQEAFHHIAENGFNEVTIGAYTHEPNIQKWYEKLGFTEFVKEAIEDCGEKKLPYNLLLKTL